VGGPCDLLSPGCPGGGCRARHRRGRRTARRLPQPCWPGSPRADSPSWPWTCRRAWTRIGAHVPADVPSATRTYTLCRPKPCLVLEPAAARAGHWSVIDLGIPDALVAEEGADLSWTDAAEAARLLPARPAGAHKGTFGHLLIVAGSVGKAGAAVLAARGALRAGVGLVTVACPAQARPEIAVQQAEVMTVALPEDPAHAPSLAGDRHAMAVGPGWAPDRTPARRVRALLSASKLPMVLDADGLNVSTVEEIRSDAPRVLTPHPGRRRACAGSPPRRSRPTAWVRPAAWPRRPAPWSCSREGGRWSRPRRAGVLQRQRQPGDGDGGDRRRAHRRGGRLPGARAWLPTTPPASPPSCTATPGTAPPPRWARTA
jgi:hypothetical protein